LHELWIKYIWFLAGCPYILVSYKIRIKLKVKKDYSYYLDSLGFRILFPSAVKLCLFFILAFLGFLLFQNGEQLNTFMLLISLISAIIETTWIIGRPHYLPGYQPNVACASCRINMHDGCYNLRSLESPEKLIKEKSRLFTPVCCCGFLIKRRVLKLQLSNL
jgi:hypothetical protein